MKLLKNLSLLIIFSFLVSAIESKYQKLKIQSEEIIVRSIPEDIDRELIIAMLPKNINKNDIVLKYEVDLEEQFEVVDIFDTENRNFSKHINKMFHLINQNKGKRQLYPYGLIYRGIKTGKGISQFTFMQTTIDAITGDILQKDQVYVDIEGKMWKIDSRYLLDPEEHHQPFVQTIIISSFKMKQQYYFILLNYCLPILLLSGLMMYKYSKQRIKNFIFRTNVVGMNKNSKESDSSEKLTIPCKKLTFCMGFMLTFSPLVFTIMVFIKQEQKVEKTDIIQVNIKENNINNETISTLKEQDITKDHDYSIRSKTAQEKSDQESSPNTHESNHIANSKLVLKKKHEDDILSNNSQLMNFLSGEKTLFENVSKKVYSPDDPKLISSSNRYIDQRNQININQYKYNINKTKKIQSVEDYDKYPSEIQNTSEVIDGNNAQPKPVSTLDVLAMIKSFEPHSIRMYGIEKSGDNIPVNHTQVVNIKSFGSEEDSNSFQIQVSSIPKIEETPNSSENFTYNLNTHSKDLSGRNTYVLDVIPHQKSENVINKNSPELKDTPKHTSCFDLDDTVNKKKKEHTRQAKHTIRHDIAFLEDLECPNNLRKNQSFDKEIINTKRTSRSVKKNNIDKILDDLDI